MCVCVMCVWCGLPFAFCCSMPQQLPAGRSSLLSLSPLPLSLRLGRLGLGQVNSSPASEARLRKEKAKLYSFCVQLTMPVCLVRGEKLSYLLPTLPLPLQCHPKFPVTDRHGALLAPQTWHHYLTTWHGKGGRKEEGGSRHSLSPTSLPLKSVSGLLCTCAGSLPSSLSLL